MLRRAATHQCDPIFYLFDPPYLGEKEGASLLRRPISSHRTNGDGDRFSARDLAHPNQFRDGTLKVKGRTPESIVWKVRNPELDLSGVGAGDPGLAFYELLSTLCARLVHVSSMPCSFSDINVTTYHFDLATISHFSLSKDHIQRQRSRVLIPIRCAPRVPSVAVGHRQAGLGPLRAASGRSQPLSGTLAHQALAAGAHHIAQARI